MNEFFFQNNVIIWLLLMVAAVILIMIIKTVVALFIKNRADTVVENDLNSILFWGTIGAGLGIFGHFAGIFIAMRSILSKMDVSPAIVSQGYLMSFSHIILGLLILLIAAICWFILRWKYKRVLP